jgi:hypothetical protein
MCQIFIVLCVYAFSIQILFPVEISDRNGLKLDPLCGLEEAIPGKDREKGEDGHATADYEHRRNSKVTLAATAQGKWFLIYNSWFLHASVRLRSHLHKTLTLQLVLEHQFRIQPLAMLSRWALRREQLYKVHV